MRMGVYCIRSGLMSSGRIDDLVDLPLAVVAPSSYWKVVFSDSPERIGFQTPPHVLQSIKKLLEKMQSR